MKLIFKSASFAFASLLLSQCASTPEPVEQERPAWVQKIDQKVARLGASNWVIISESAYPLHNKKGIEMVVMDQSIPDVTRAVLDSMDRQGHVSARVYTSRELSEVKESYAPGVKKLRKRIGKVLQDQKAQEISHKTIESLLKQSRSDFKVLVIKTNSSFPYSSIFMELRSGYWDGESEQALRSQDEG